MDSSIKEKMINRISVMQEENFTPLYKPFEFGSLCNIKETLPKLELDDRDFVLNRVSGDETLQYITERFEALPYILSPSERLQLKSNVIASHFSHMLNLPSMPKVEAKAEAWVLWAETSRKLIERAARDIPDSQLGLKFASVMLPYNEATADYYEARMAERESLIETYESYCTKQGIDYKAELLSYTAVIWLDIECSTGYMTWRNASESLVRDIVLWQRITKKDFLETNERYVAYIKAKAAKMSL